MPKTGTKKVMTKEVDKTQYCIDAVLIDEVLDSLPKTGITIVGASVDINHYSARKRLPIPNKLKRLGVSLLSKRDTDVRCVVVFDKTTPAIIKRNVRLACQTLGASLDKASFGYLTINNGKSAGKFQRTKKDIIPSDNDLRRKTVVLGLIDAEGDVAGLIKSVSADAYKCNIQTIETRVVVCTK